LVKTRQLTKLFQQCGVQSKISKEPFSAKKISPTGQNSGTGDQPPFHDGTVSAHLDHKII